MSSAIAEIERDGRLRCVIGLRCYFASDRDARSDARAVRDLLAPLAPAPFQTIEYRHREQLNRGPLTAARAKQLDGWLTGPWRQAALDIHIAGDGDNVLGFQLDKPDPARSTWQLVYRGWPVAWALERLAELERMFEALVPRTIAAHLGPMVVVDPAWPVGVSLGSLIDQTTNAIARHPEWDVLELRGPGLLGVSWLTAVGGTITRASPAPIGPEAAAGQAAVFAKLEPTIAPATLALSNPEIRRIARHQPAGRLARFLELAAAHHTAAMSACDGNAQQRARSIELARELLALGLPDRDGAGRLSRVHPTYLYNLVPTSLHHASGPDLPAHVATAWDLLGDTENHHGTRLRAELLARVDASGPVARKQSWQDPDAFREVSIVGVLPALFAAGGLAAIAPYLDAAVALADDHPVIHHALARIHHALGDHARVAAHVAAAERADYAYDISIDRAIAGDVDAPVMPAALEPAQVVFAGPNLVLVNHATRGRFTFHCQGAPCRKGDTVRIGGFDGVKARFIEVAGRLFAEW